MILLALLRLSVQRRPQIGPVDRDDDNIGARRLFVRAGAGRGTKLADESANPGDGCWRWLPRRGRAPAFRDGGADCARSDDADGHVVFLSASGSNGWANSGTVSRHWRPSAKLLYEG